LPSAILINFKGIAIFLGVTEASLNLFDFQTAFFPNDILQKVLYVDYLKKINPEGDVRRKKRAGQEARPHI